MKTVKLIECIRNTWQGEGPDCLKRMTLCRFKYCNKKCYFCDTLIKMHSLAEAKFSLYDIQKIIKDEKTNIMISGGEPTIDKHLSETLMLLNELEYPIANVETNGYNIKELIEKTNPDKNVKFIYSPKFFTKDELNKDIKLINEIHKDDRVYIKIVAQSDNLITLYLKHLDDLKINNKVYLMPQGKNREELIKNASVVFDLADKFKMNISSREHLIYEFI